MRWLNSALLLLIFALLSLAVACIPQTEDAPGALDLDLTAVVRQNELRLSATPPTPTHTPLPTATPTRTPVPTAIPPSPTYSVDRSRFFGPALPAGAWQTGLFINSDTEQPQSLASFRGQVIVVQTLSTICQACQEQSRILNEVLTRLIDIRLADFVQVVLLSIDPEDRAQDMLAYQAEYLPALGGQSNWVAGLASGNLIQELGLLLGELGGTYLNRIGGGIFFVDKSGFGQASGTGDYDLRGLEDRIIHLIGGPGLDEELITPEASPDSDS